MTSVASGIGGRAVCLQSLYRVAHIDFGVVSVQILRKFVAGGLLGHLFFTFPTSDDVQLKLVVSFHFWTLSSQPEISRFARISSGS
jgi:hypothetical protein